MPYEKLLEVVVVDLFTGKNRSRRRKSATKSARTASFRHLAVKSGPGRHLEAFLALGAGQIFLKGLFCAKLLAMSWRPGI
jgi:hypothetical protein